MNIRVYDNWEDLEALRIEWNSVLAQSPTNEVFLTFEFLKTWDRSGTRTTRPHVIVAQNGGGIAGIAPLMLAERRVLGARLITAEFLGTPYIDYADFLYTDKSVLPALWEAAMALKRRVDAAYLQQIPESSPTVSFLETESRLPKRKSADCLAAALPEQRGMPVKAFLKKPDYARHVRRYIRLLEEKGKLTLDTYSTPADVTKGLDILIRQHRTRWNATDTPSCFNRPAFVDLYRNISAALAASGNLLLAILRLNGAPLACHWGFLYANKFLLHTTSLNIDYWNYYCGPVLMLKIEQFLNETQPGIQQLDFSRGTEHYKTYFADLHSINVEFISTSTLKAASAMRAFLWGSDLARALMGTLRRYHGLLQRP